MDSLATRVSDCARTTESAPRAEAQIASGATRVAVLIPCFNEAATIDSVVRGFQEAIPTAEVYVYDNNSRDETVNIAATAGATVRRELLQGKGNVVRRMFADIEADVYVMVDGDGTYDPHCAESMIRLLLIDKLDMVVATRVASQNNAFRHGHRFGNKLLTSSVGHLFGSRFTDMLSGYRAFSRRFVKSFPAMSSGFETETELTIHALELALPVAEIESAYSGRIQGSVSKLNTFSDGLKILRLILVLYKNERPLQFFSAIAAILCAISLALGIPVVVEFIRTGLVLRQPTAILATGLVLLSALSLVTGLILDTVTRGRRETRRLAYLAIKAP